MNEAFIWLTEKYLMARNVFRIFTENNPVMGYSKTFFIPEAKGLKNNSRYFLITNYAVMYGEIWTRNT